MKLKVLVDNNTYIDQYYYGEPAVSYYIEDEDTNLLLDVGYSDIFMKNANALDVDLESVNTIVISHGHDDHIFSCHSMKIITKSICKITKVEYHKGLTILK